MTGWNSYRVILEEAVRFAEEDRLKVPVDCPTCGSILAVNSAGVRSCPMGHYRSGVAGI